MAEPGLRLELQIQRPKEVYTNGDTISGFAVLHVEDRIDLRTILVELHGRSESKSTSGLYNAVVQTHLVVSKLVDVFPDIVTASDSDTMSSTTFTLLGGVYRYPFSFTVPDEDTMMECLRYRFSRSHADTESCGFLVDILPDHPATMPPTFLHIQNPNFAYVSYFVTAEAHRPGFYRPNLKAVHHIKFAPINAALTYLISHLCEAPRRLMGDALVHEFLLGFAPPAPLKLIWKKLKPTRVNVPFQLLCDFMPYKRQKTEYGPSNRFLYPGPALPSFVAITLVLPLSPRNVAHFLLGDGSGAAAPSADARLPSETLIITGLKVSILQLVAYQGAQTFSNCLNSVLLDEAIHYEIPWKLFEPTNASFMRQLEHLKTKYGDLLDGQCYKFTLPQEWFEKYVPPLPQSFVSCNIKNEYLLEVKLSLATLVNPKKTVKIKSFSPFVMLANEGPTSYEEYAHVY